MITWTMCKVGGAYNPDYKVIGAYNSYYKMGGA